MSVAQTASECVCAGVCLNHEAKKEFRRKDDGKPAPVTEGKGKKLTTLLDILWAGLEIINETVNDAISPEVAANFLVGYKATLGV